jgi:hypothetical protein
MQGGGGGLPSALGIGPVTSEDIKVPDKMVGLSEYSFQSSLSLSLQYPLSPISITTSLAMPPSPLIKD